MVLNSALIERIDRSYSPHVFCSDLLKRGEAREKCRIMHVI